MKFRRRTFLQMGTGLAIATAVNACSRSQTASNSTTQTTAENPGKIRIGYWPHAGGLPLYVAVEKGYFKDAGLDVEAVQFASTTQIAEAILAKRLEGTGNGVSTVAMGLLDINSPKMIKILAGNPSNKTHVLESVIVAKNGPIRSVADLKGQKIAVGPGPQHKAVVEEILSKNGITDAQVVQIELKQHVAAIESGQVAAAYTLEPTGTVGELKGVTRYLETGVVSKYVLDDPNAPWFGGAAALVTEFVEKYPQATKTYAEAYRKAIQDIRNNPDEVRQYLQGYTSIQGEELTKKVPLAAYTMYDEFTPQDIQYFQKFYDFMRKKQVFSRDVDAASLIYRPA